MARNGWHVGERLIHKKLGHENDYAIMMLYADIQGDLPAEHALFHSTRLPFLPVTTLDSSGRPWGSILAGKDGELGFIRNSQYSVLSINAKLWPGEPLVENSKLYKDDGSMLIAGIGIEFSTRRRNKLAGKVTRLEMEGLALRLDLLVDEALGNCPKYINVRELVPHPDTTPTVVYSKLTLDTLERLPDELITFITESDTVFLGTTYSASPEDAQRLPSHLGMNQRGGRPGFIRVFPSDGRTVVLPDYSGNRFLTSLGNIEATPLASLTFISFTTGNILYLTGQAQNIHDRTAAQRIMPLQNALTTVRVTGYVYVSDALPVRQRSGSSPQRSPYSPPVRLLAEELTNVTTMFGGGDGGEDPPVTALLTRVTLHDPSVPIATFTWEASAPLCIVPGQAVIMDFTPLLGEKKYRHLAPMDPTSVNDDRIRTWTVSSSVGPSATSTTALNATSASSTSAAVADPSRTFSVTMRERPGGLVTTALFSILRKLYEVNKKELMDDARPLGLSVKVLGVTGEFGLPPLPLPSPSPLPPVTTTTTTCRMLWIAGGIGVTPFLAMLRSLHHSNSTVFYDIQLVLSTREPEVLIPLISSALRRDNKPTSADGAIVIGDTNGGVVNPPKQLNLSIDVFSRRDVPRGSTSFFESNENVRVVVRYHPGRITRDAFERRFPLDSQDELDGLVKACTSGGGGDAGDGGIEVGGREVYVCGPEGFENAVMGFLEEGGVERGVVRRETFTY